MSGRDEGFATADRDTSWHDDPKVRALRRRLGPSELAAAWAMLAYDALVNESWRAGRRLSLEDTTPEWIPATCWPAIHEAIRADGLADADGRVPEAIWDRWFGEAYRRREALRAKWRRKAANRREAAGEFPGDSARNPQGSPRIPSVSPSVYPSDRGTPGPSPPATAATIGPEPASLPNGRAWGSFGPEWDPFRAAWAARGFRRPPTQAQRAKLWGEDENHGAVRDWPAAAAGWVAEPPAGTPAAAVIGHVLSRFHATRRDAARD